MRWQNLKGSDSCVCFGKRGTAVFANFADFADYGQRRLKFYTATLRNPCVYTGVTSKTPVKKIRKNETAAIASIAVCALSGPIGWGAAAVLEAE